MDKRHIFVENVTKLNNVIQQTFQATDRLKLISFDVSKHYIIFGVSSGGLYFFDRRRSEFKKLIPSKGGTADLISISPNERNVAIANSKGLVIILENCFAQDVCRYQIYDEHEEQTVTALKWHDSDLYCGDSSGKVSVILSLNLLTKAIFNTPVAAILHLDSPVVQIDTFHKYLLVSTKTRTYLCDTLNENFKPVGKKLRDGPFGACFFPGCAKANETSTSCNATSYNKKVKSTTESDGHQCKIYCGRPGARLWEANFEGEVIYTHQFRNISVNKQLTDVVVLGDDPDSRISVADHSNGSSPFNLNFEKMYVIAGQFIITFNKSNIYIINPVTGSLMFWSNFYDNINDLKVIDSKVFIWQNKQIFTLNIPPLDELILETLFRKQFYACAELCIKFSDDIIGLVDKSSKIHLIGALKMKLTELGDTDLLEKVSPLLEKVQELSQQKISENPSSGIKIVENAYYVEGDDSTADDINISDGILNFKSISLVSEKINEGTKLVRKNLQVLETKVKKLTSDSVGKNMNFRNGIIKTVPKKMKTDARLTPKRNIELEKPNMPDLIEDIDPDDLDYKLKILLAQYKLNKVHRNVETTRVTRMLERATLQSLKELHADFIKHADEVLNEDASKWCNGQFLKFVHKTMPVDQIGGLESHLREHLHECFCGFNTAEDWTCSCGFPLPYAKKQKPMYYEIGLALASLERDNPKMLAKVPFMWGHRISTLPDYDIFANIPLILQFNDLEMIKKFSVYFVYDNWDDTVKLFIKLKQERCVNCDSKIDNKGLMTWSDLGFLMLRHLSGPNTMKLMQKYGAHIGKDELDDNFYRCCIFTTTLAGVENMFGSKPLDLFLKLNSKKAAKIQLEKCLREFLEKRYVENTFETRYLLPCTNCCFCDMPINLEMLGYQILDCSHFFHKLCLLYIENVCILCNKDL